jgi:hypothetical protein
MRACSNHADGLVVGPSTNRRKTNAMPIYGDEKILSMKRSVLPAKAHTRNAARLARAAAHRNARRTERALRTVIDPTESDHGSADLYVTGAHSAERRRSIEISHVVWRRQSSDKVAPLIRWANARANDLGNDPDTRVAALRSLVGRGLIADHAISHVRDSGAFVDPNDRFYASRIEWKARAELHPRQMTSLRARLEHGLRERADRFGELNRAIKDAATPDGAPVAPRPRLLHGLHDISAFVDEIMTAYVNRARHGRSNATWPVVFQFVGIDPNDPHADFKGRR